MDKVSTVQYVIKISKIFVVLHFHHENPHSKLLTIHKCCVKHKYLMIMFYFRLDCI